METILETQRTILRHFSMEDEQAVFVMNSDPEVQRSTSDVIIKSLKEARATISDIWFAD